MHYNLNVNKAFFESLLVILRDHNSKGNVTRNLSVYYILLAYFYIFYETIKKNNQLLG